MGLQFAVLAFYSKQRILTKFKHKFDAIKLVKLTYYLDVMICMRFITL